MNKTKPHCSLLEERLRCQPIKRYKLHVIVTKEETTKDNRPITRRVFKVYEPSKTIKALSIRDFSISSLMSVGADLHLTNLSHDMHTSVDNIKTSLSVLDSSINSDLNV